MNIFYIDEDPIQAAQWMVDKHVVKMILESAQLLSTAHRILDGEMVEGKKMVAGSIPVRWRKFKTYKLHDSREPILYKATHINHPSAIWCRTAVENYNWLLEHFFALGSEYTHRYGKVHKCFQGDLAYQLQSPPHNLRNYDMTIMPSAMADEYKISNDPCTNYKNYYRIGKSKLHKWTNRQPPEWINE